MFSSSQPQPQPWGGSSHSKRRSRWISRLFHQATDRNFSNTGPVGVQQQQAVYERSPSGNPPPENNTTIAPRSLSRRRPCRPSLWRRVCCHRRRGKTNQGLDLAEVEPHRGFSPPRNRQQPEWMQQWRDDVADRVGWIGEPGEHNDDRRSEDATGATDMTGAVWMGVREVLVSNSDRNDDVVVG